MAYLSCPQCGQPNAPTETSCTYCHAPLKFAPTPSEPESDLPSDTDHDALLAAMSACPKCRGPLEVGYMPAPTYLNWVKSPAPGGLFDASPLKEDKLVTFGEALSVAPFVKAHVPGLRCRKCNLVLLDFT